MAHVCSCGWQLAAGEDGKGRRQTDGGGAKGAGARAGGPLKGLSLRDEVANETVLVLFRNWIWISSSLNKTRYNTDTQ